MLQREKASPRGTMSRCWLVAAAFLCVSMLAAYAQGNIVERQVKAAPGRDVRVGIYIDIRPDCTSGPLPAIRLAAPPAHGAVSVKRGTFKATNFKQCLATEAPAFVAFYRAKDGYGGTDAFALEITWVGGRKELQRFRVNVSDNPAGGHGI